MCDKKQLDCIIKLGGRAVTLKEKFEKSNSNAIQAAVNLFTKASEDEVGQFVIVHGAGSFGHFQAKEYGVADGYRADTQSPEYLKQVQLGLCKTRLSVTKLNHMIVSEFVQQSIPAVGMSPFTGWITNGKDKIVHCDIDVLRQCLQDGYLPVVHGDAVIDNTTGCCILSGDTIIQTLCFHLNPKRVIFLTDVDGIYDRPPSQPGANHIPRVTVNQDGCIATALSTTVSGHDVTGGIASKIQCAAQIVSQSNGRTRVFIGRLGSEVSKRLVRYGLSGDGLSDAGLMTEVCFEPSQT